jgi:hypothetical protein
VLSMNSRRAAVYFGGGALLVAWLAAANTTRQSDPPLPAPVPQNADPVEKIAIDLQQDGARLRDQLTHAPAPQVNSRNLFGFASVPAPRASAPRPTAAAESAVAEVPPPPLPLTLMGIAEQASASGPARTAILGGSGDDVYMVTVGQTIAARYSVTAIGVDAIELKDLATGGFRRLALR